MISITLVSKLHMEIAHVNLFNEHANNEIYLITMLIENYILH